MSRVFDQQRLEDAITTVALQMRVRDMTLTRTKLVKLLYFVDLEAWDYLGHPITGVEWTWWHYGPYSKEIDTACAVMEQSGELEVVQTNNYFGSPEYRITSSVPGYWTAPSKDIERIIRHVVERLGKLAPTKIGDLSYDTEPMKRLQSSGGTRGDVIEFPERVPERDVVEATLAHYASIELDESEYGDPAEDLRQIANDLDQARRSAGSKVIG